MVPLLRSEEEKTHLQEVNNNVAEWSKQVEPNMVGMLILWTSTIFVYVSLNPQGQINVQNG